MTKKNSMSYFKGRCCKSKRKKVFKNGYDVEDGFNKAITTTLGPEKIVTYDLPRVKELRKWLIELIVGLVVGIIASIIGGIVLLFIFDK